MNSIKKRIMPFWPLLFTLLLLTACSEEVKRGLRPVPTAYGDINQVVVIADKDVWEGNIGDTIRYYYSAAYPILPQPEPIFDLFHFTPEEMELEPVRKELRNYLIVANLADQDSPTAAMIRRDIGEENVRRAKEDARYNSTVGRDKWATGQLLVYQFALTGDVLVDNLKQNFPAIAKRFNEADRDKIEATIFFQGENSSLENEVRSKMDAEIRIPKDYFLALSDGNVIWMRKETSKLSSNLILRKVAYTDQAQLSRKGIKAIRDSIGRQYVSSTLPNTYMKINDVDLPMFTSVKTLNNNYALEARGIWEIANDYMGGAFVSYLIHNPNKRDLLFVDGFVHAPGEEKRDYMQQLEYIISTVHF